MTTVDLAHDRRGSGPLVVLVHGITEDRTAWDPVTEDLARDHTVLRVDLRGHGASPAATSYGPEEYAADLAPLVDAPALMVGHSLGGMVVTAYAAGHPVRGVVNVDQSLDLAGLQAQVQQAAPLLRGPEFPAVMDQLFGSMRGSLDDAEWARLTGLRDYRQDVVLGTWSILLDNDRAGVEAEVRQLTGSVRAPYLALHGADPGAGYADWLRERIAQAEVEVWDGHGHHPHLVAPQRFLDRLRAFESTL